MNRERRSLRELNPISLLCFIIPSATSFTTLIASFSLFSEPIPRSRFARQTHGDEVMARSAESLEARSNASARSETGRLGRRQPGSRPNDILHMLSKENLLSMSCKSKTFSLFISPRAVETAIGSKREWISSLTNSIA